MPAEPLADREDFASDVGISPDGAMTLLVARGLRDEGDREPPRQKFPAWNRSVDRERRGRD